MPMAETLEGLRALTDAEVVSKYNEIAKRTNIGTDYYAAELNRRYNERHAEVVLGYSKKTLDHTEAMHGHSEAMLGFTNRIKWMTIVITGATLINLGVAGAMLWVMLNRTN